MDGLSTLCTLFDGVTVTRLCVTIIYHFHMFNMFMHVVGRNIGKFKTVLYWLLKLEKTMNQIIFIPPQTSFAGVYSDPYVRPFIRSSVHPSQSLIRYSSKTAEQNFMKLSGIVHYMMPYCTSYYKIFSAWFWGFPEQNKDFAITTYWGGGTHL